ncbi:uncharacterized protein LOC130719646 [Lotus japonicus]|uniref:uncharacterized protein LOC130719646 n=1 Tax=Lotus japonicus TaxID=34305 RepID=UPI00258AD5F9|nr:uncharacterized protein LOC130719646 [Lotus japonicus]
MRRDVFLRIVEAIDNNDDYFQMREDATCRMCLSPLHKCNVAIRMLAFGSPADSVDEYVQIGESTIVECLVKFVTRINEVFKPKYLRKPNNHDITRLMEIRDARGFPSSNNDINVLNQSDVFNEVLHGQAPEVQFTLNGTTYDT